MAWSKNGNDIIGSIQEHADIKEIDPSNFKGKIEREVDKKLSVNRKQLYLDAVQMTPEDFFNKYRPVTSKVRFKAIVKSVLRKFGLISFVKKIVG